MIHSPKPSCFQTLPFIASEHVSHKKLYPHIDCLAWDFFILHFMTCDDLPTDKGSMAALVCSPQFMVTKPCFFSCSLIHSRLKTREVQTMLFSGIWISISIIVRLFLMTGIGSATNATVSPTFPSKQRFP